MTPAQTLAQMAAVVQAQYEKEQRRFATLVAEENKLRAELMRLNDMQRNTTAPAASVAQMRAIGADVIWQAWVGRSKVALNMQLARVLAQKEHLQNAVRLAYGKVLVVNEMRQEALESAQRQAARGQLDSAIQQSLWR